MNLIAWGGAWRSNVWRVNTWEEEALNNWREVIKFVLYFSEQINFNLER